MSPKVAWRRISRCAGLVAGALLAVVAVASPEGLSQRRLDLRDFARPATVPFPPDNPATAAQIALGAALFTDTRLSRDGSTACATCHDPALGFTDGASRGKGLAGVTLKRNAPTLWNLAWGDSFFWDGRASSLEEQARGPIEHPLEMDMKLADAVSALRADPMTREAFKAAFGADGVTEANILKALAAFERTLVSPKTRFDKWVEGDEQALTPAEIKGFELFTGRAGCSRCHGTWRFTDEAFHDIGLPEGADRGRGEAVGQPWMNNAFKTPTLRELVWTAPYMHDGSMATLDAVNDHYFGGIENRTTISKDLPVFTPVFTSERLQLTAFLKTLSSDNPPQPMRLAPAMEEREAMAFVEVSHVRERNRRFMPAAVRIRKGQPLTILNDDERIHSLRVDDPRLTLSTDAQEPGTSVVLTFPETGTYTVASSIHPGMRLSVEVVE